jgi:hypothetical protein
MFRNKYDDSSNTADKTTCNELIDPTCRTALVPFAQQYNGAGIPQGGGLQKLGNKRVVPTFARVEEDGGPVYDTTLEGTTSRIPPMPGTTNKVRPSLDGDGWLPGFTD